jgi:hypothetical protein
MKKELGLKFIWNIRLKLWAEGNKLWAEGDKLRVEGNKLWAEGDKLRAEGNKLRAEGNKLRAEGDKLRAEGNKLRAEGNKLWAEGIIEVYGNIKLEWKNYNEKYQSYGCHLETGEIFGYYDEKEKDNSEDMIQELEKRGKIKNGKIII